MTKDAPQRVLLAGVGNELRGDDGVGVEALRRLERELGAREGLVYFESGIAGIALVQKLMDGFDMLVILDAIDRKAEPGTVFVIAPEIDPHAAPVPIDLHEAGPEGVLRLADALGVRPASVWIVGCQPEDCDVVEQALSPSVAAALPEIILRVRELLDAVEPRPSEADAPTKDGGHVHR